MCIIIHKPKAKTTIPARILDRSESINQHGFGITYLDDLSTHLTMDYSEARELVEAPRPFVAHYRFATVGEVSVTNCHPFRMKRAQSWLYSNGTVEGLKMGDRTDTEAVARILDKIPAKYWASVLAMTPTRFAIVSKKGKVQRYGKWIKKNGVWYSKANVLEKPRPQYATQYELGWGDAWRGGEVSTNATQRYGKAYVPKTPKSSKAKAKATIGYCRQPIAKIAAKDVPSHKATTAPPTPTYHPRMETELNSWEGKHVVAVYGTLKGGLCNHDVISAGSSFIGDATTVDSLRMTVDGLPKVYRGEHEDGHHVEVEVYELHDVATMEAADRLEGHPSLYERELTKLNLDGEEVEAWLYFYNGVPSSRRFVACYHDSVNGEAKGSKAEEARKQGEDTSHFDKWNSYEQINAQLNSWSDE